MSASNLKIGACDVWFKGEYLGKTKGGVTVTLSPENVKLTVDQYGETPVDFASNGMTMKVTVRLAELDLAKWQAAQPLGTTVTGKRVTFGKNAGARLASQAGLLVCHPLGVTGAAEDIVLHKAVATDEIEVDYNNEDQRVLEIPFIGLVDDTKSDGNWLGHVGDSV